MIWNGILPGDEEGNYTYIAHNGSSVIDYNFFAFKMLCSLDNPSSGDS